jgi:hypothetical protein
VNVRLLQVVALTVALAGVADGQVTAVKRVGPPRPEPKPTALSLSPAGEPRPALRYRLLPLSSELTPGNAAPVYLRIRHELSTGYKEMQDEVSRLRELPFDQLPKEEARKLVDQWAPRLRQIHYGARRQFCDWGYTLPEERENAIEILLPDAQEMRVWARLLKLKARVEIAEGKRDDAVETLQTGLAFGRHVAEGPFLINGLVGIAICQLMLEELETLIGQPGAPNLYWALTALPRPMISLRTALETEEILGENLIPELAELRDPEGRRTDDEWASLLRRLHARVTKVGGKLHSYGQDTPQLKILRELSLAALRAQALPEAERYARDRLGWSDVEVKAATADQKVALYLAGRYRELRDDLFKTASLGPLDARAVRARTDAARDAAKREPAVGLFVELMPAVEAAVVSQARLDRRIAALRLIEAIRLHADASGGRLPETLDEIKLVPVPADPLRNRPFDYTRDVETARLDAPADPFPPPALSYTLSLRK